MNMKKNALDRFTVCLEKGLLSRLDEISAERGYPSRSQAVSDFIRRAIVKKYWKGGRDCAATISVVYDPADSRPGRGIETLLRANAGVLSAQVHQLRGGRTLCTVTATGRPAALQRLADSLRALKGVAHGSFSIVAPL
jgi:CopG family nickel-responsive transcriptional regulator